MRSSAKPAGPVGAQGSRAEPSPAEVSRPTRKPARPRLPPRRAREAAEATLSSLRALYPDAHCELDFGSPFQLLVATVLSAQTTDVLVNKVTPHIFASYPDARWLAAADPAAIARTLASLGMGMFNQKAKNIVGLSRLLMERHGGEVPRTLAELVELPGVGRKTANVVLGVVWGAPEGVVVDTHVQRLAQRFGWTKNREPDRIERDLCSLFPRSEWDLLSHTLIFHGRRVCFARKPACAGCGVSGACPSAFRAENIGRKPKRARRPAAAAAPPTAKRTRDSRGLDGQAPASRQRRSPGPKVR